MIRAAKAADIPDIIAFLEQGYRGTHYARNKVADIDVPFTKELLLMSVFRHGQPTENSTWVEVVERKGAIVGLMLATLCRVYVIGNRLMASDLLFHVNEHASAADAPTLAFRMLQWAERSPLCVEVRCGTTDIHGDAERAGRLLQKFGMSRYGSIWRKEFERAAA